MGNGGPQVTYDQVWEEQENLAALLSPKTSRSFELYWPNNNYGASRVLKEYAGYPLRKPLYAIVPHGVYLGADERVPTHEKDAGLPAVLSFPEYLDRAYRKRSRMVVLPSAAPFLYALENVGGLPQYEERKGLIYFPTHSTAKVRREAPLDDIAERLVALPDEYQPVTVCVHWYDHSIGFHEPFEKRGLRIVSAGHLHDDVFMYRLIHLFAVHRYAGSNGLGSNVFYALACGLPYWITPDVRATTIIDSDFETPRPSGERAVELARMHSMFAELPEEVTEEQRKLAMSSLGAHRLKSPHDLLSDLLYAEKLAQQR